LWVVTTTRPPAPAGFPFLNMWKHVLNCPPKLLDILWPMFGNSQYLFRQPAFYGSYYQSSRKIIGP
jgi:hypothetical protein